MSDPKEIRLRLRELRDADRFVPFRITTTRGDNIDIIRPTQFAMNEKFLVAFIHPDVDDENVKVYLRDVKAVETSTAIG